MAKPLWARDLEGRRQAVVNHIKTVQHGGPHHDGPEFNPAVDFWSSEQGADFLSHVAKLQNTSCVLWHGTASPVIKPDYDVHEVGSVDDASDDVELCSRDNYRMSPNLLATARRLQEEPFDIVVIVMKRGAEYVANLPSMGAQTARNVIWVDLGAAEGDAEKETLTALLEFVVERLAAMRKGHPRAEDPAGMLCGTLAQAVEEITQILGEGVTCGINQADDIADIPEPEPFPAGMPRVRDRFSNRSSDDKALNLLARISLQERWNWLGEGNPDCFAPQTATQMSTKEDLRGAVDIAHCDSAMVLVEKVRHALRVAKPEECGKPVVLGVAAGWPDAVDEGEDSSNFENSEHTRAVIQHVATHICEEPDAFAKDTIVIRQVVIVDIGQDSKAALIEALARHVVPSIFSLEDQIRIKDDEIAAANDAKDRVAADRLLAEIEQLEAKSKIVSDIAADIAVKEIELNAATTAKDRTLQRRLTQELAGLEEKAKSKVEPDSPELPWHSQFKGREGVALTPDRHAKPKTPDRFSRFTSPMVIWLDVRDVEGRAIEVPMAALEQVFLIQQKKALAHQIGTDTLQPVKVSLLNPRCR